MKNNNASTVIPFILALVGAWLLAASVNPNIPNESRRAIDPSGEYLPQQPLP